MSEVAALIDELQKLKARLAYVQDRLSGARLARRRVRDSIALDCLRMNMTEKKMTDWRPMTPAEVERLDAVHVATAPVISEFLPQEAVLKEAVRHTEINLERAKKLRAEPGVEPGKTGGRKTPPVHTVPCHQPGPGKVPPVPSPTGGETGENPVRLKEQGTGARTDEWRMSWDR
jgi:hypothetical protein